jgi:hypothetical protein
MVNSARQRAARKRALAYCVLREHVPFLVGVERLGRRGKVLDERGHGAYPSCTPKREPALALCALPLRASANHKQVRAAAALAGAMALALAVRRVTSVRARGENLPGFPAGASIINPRAPSFPLFPTQSFPQAIFSTRMSEAAAAPGGWPVTARGWLARTARRKWPCCFAVRAPHSRRYRRRDPPFACTPCSQARYQRGWNCDQQLP